MRRKLNDILTKDFLIKKYLNEKLSTHDIAKKYNIGHSSVLYYLKKFNIKARSKSDSLKGKKRPIEQMQKLHESNKGRIPWNKNKKGIYSEETIKKIRQANINRNWKKENHPNWKGGKPKCIDCGKKLSTYTAKRCIKCYNNYNRGKNHYNWQNGITPIIFQIRNCFKYRQWRSDVFTRDNFQCIFCGTKGTIEADHYPKLFSQIFHENNIKSIADALKCEEFWNINNGRTLCIECHKKFGVNPRHKKNRKIKI